MLTEVRESLFNIPKRLKHISKDYKVYYNHKKGVYEVHCEAQPDNTYSFCAGKELDYRVLIYARKYNIENFKRIMNEIITKNELTERQIMENLKEQFNDELSFKLNIMEQHSVGDDSLNKPNDYKGGLL